MSYILEALEKSEQERKQNAVPDLQTQPTAYPGMTRSRARRTTHSSPRLRPAILLGIALVLSAWLLRDHLPVELEIKITRQIPLAADSSQNQIKPPVQSETPVVPAALPQVNPLQQNDDNQPEQLANQDAPQAKTNESEAISNVNSNATAQEEIISPSSWSQTANIEADLANREKVTLQPAPIMLTDANNPESIAIAEPLPYLNELPAAKRQELPTMKFAGHTYSTIARDRLIIINNGIKREGDSVAPGLKLEEITWDGVILNFHGLRFQVIATGS